METHCRISKITPKAGYKPGALAAHGGASGVTLQAYDAGAGSGQRQSSWLATAAGVNTSIIAHAATLRNRARDTIRKNAWAQKIVGAFVSNAIGTGIRPKSKHPDRALRVTLHELWQDWTEESEAEGVEDFYGQQATAVRAI